MRPSELIAVLVLALLLAVSIAGCTTTATFAPVEYTRAELAPWPHLQHAYDVNECEQDMGTDTCVELYDWLLTQRGL